MCELRRDPVSDRWVISAPNRNQRPNDYQAAAQATSESQKGDCPFCAGNEKATPEAIVAYPQGRRWQVRVVPNKFPAIHSPAADFLNDGPFLHTQPASGFHEVVVESANHLCRFSELSPTEAELTFRAYRDRFRAWSRVNAVQSAIAFKNCGVEAGASIEHCHSQLIALPFVPTQMEIEIRNAQAHFETHDRCIFCELIEREIEKEERIVAADQGLVALCPFASRFAYETWILPRSHASHFHETDDQGLSRLSLMASEILTRLDQAVGCPPHNYVIHSAPFDSYRSDHYHWHIEILPRVSRAAGFEWGTGVHINVVRPEDAASVLRNVRVTRDAETRENAKPRKDG